MITLRRGVLIGLVLLLGALGCGKKAGTAGGKPKVAVSIFPLYDVTRRIAGDRLDVVLVLPAGASEHGYEPTPKEIAALEGSKLGIAVGLDMDRWVENIMKSAGDPPVFRVGDKVKTIPVALEPIGEGEDGHHHDDHDDHDKGSGSAVKKTDDHDDHDHDKGSGSAVKKTDDHDHDDHDHDHDKGSAKPPEKKPEAKKPEEKKPEEKKPEEKKSEKDHHDHAEVGSPDPHFWMDPDRMAGAVDSIVAELTKIDAAGKDTFAANGEAVKKSLRELDGKIAARAKAWSKHTIVTFHGSMAYYAKRYGIVIAAVVEPVAGTEPTAAYIDQVVAAIKRSKAAGLFTEPQLAKGPGEAIAREAGGIPLGELDPVGGVAGRDTYEALLIWNTDQLEKVLR